MPKIAKYRLHLYLFGNRISVYVRYIYRKIPPKIPYTAKYPYTPSGTNRPYFGIYTVYIPQNKLPNTVCVSSSLVAGMLPGGSSFVLPEVMGGVQRIIR